MSKPMDRSKRHAALAFCSACGRMLGIGAMAFLLALAPKTAVAAERLSICHGSAASALVPLAKLRGFYAAEGLDVEVKNYPSGFQALEAMLSGQCSLAAVGVPPVVHQSLRRNDFRILAAIASSRNFERLIVRRDRGIHGATDLRGRRIAVAESTTAHYFHDLFLAAHGVAPSEVTQVYLPAQEVGAAFRRGDVDAAAHWEPHIQVLAKEFGNRAQVMSTPGLHVNPFLLLARLDRLQQHPTAIKSVLRALLRAERFAREQPALASPQLAGYFGMEQTLFDIVWPLHDYRVSLDQPLLFTLENVARWNLGRLPSAQRPAMPNYLDFIYLDALKAVRPESVNLIH